MPQDGRNGRNCMDPHIRSYGLRQPDRSGRFKNVQDGRQEAGQESGSPHRICPSGPAACNGPDIPACHQFHDDQAKRDGTY